MNVTVEWTGDRPWERRGDGDETTHYLRDEGVRSPEETGGEDTDHGTTHWDCYALRDTNGDRGCTLKLRSGG